MTISSTALSQISSIEALISTDAGNRGMKDLIIPGDLLLSATTMAHLPPSSHILILTGFPCCVKHTPPTETDGPPGAISIARTALALGLKVTLVTDECNETVFRAAISAANLPPDSINLEIYPPENRFTSEDKQRMRDLVQHRCDLIVSCERAGPARDGMCYTMRGINMTSQNLIAPIHDIIPLCKHMKPHVKYIAIGDGGNELGMGKVIAQIRNSNVIQNGDRIGAVTECDYLIAASVSNWGGYALSAACAVVKNDDEGYYSHGNGHGDSPAFVETTDESSSGDEDEYKHKYNCKSTSTSSSSCWVEKCVPTEAYEIALLEKCVQAGCRDGVSGEMEATVDGMPLQTSMDCLNDIRSAAKAILE